MCFICNFCINTLISINFQLFVGWILQNIFLILSHTKKRGGFDAWRIRKRNKNLQTKKLTKISSKCVISALLQTVPDWSRLFQEQKPTLNLMKNCIRSVHRFYLAMMIKSSSIFFCDKILWPVMTVRSCFIFLNSFRIILLLFYQIYRKNKTTFLMQTIFKS